MADSQYDGQTRVQVLLEYIQEREIDIEDMGAVRRIKLEQCIQLCQFESDANQVRTKRFKKKKKAVCLKGTRFRLSAGFRAPKVCLPPDLASLDVSKTQNS